MLTTTMGGDSDETSLPFSGARKSEIALSAAANGYRYVLDRRVVGEPGQRWTYCGGVTARLARLIA